MKPISYNMSVVTILGAAALWAICFLLRKIIAANAGPFFVTCLSAAAAFIFLWAIICYRKENIIPAFKQAPLFFISNALLSMTIGSTAMFYGLSKVDLSVAVILEKTQPIYTLIIAALFIGERHNLKTIILSILAISLSTLIFQHHNGLTLTHINMQDFLIHWIGWLSITLAAIAWGASAVLSRVMSVKGLDPIIMAALRALIGGIAVIPLALWEMQTGHYQITAKIIGFSILIGVLGGGLGYILCYWGLQKVQAGTASLIELTTPIIAIIFGVIFLNEQLDLISYTLIGLLLITICYITKIKNQTPLPRR